MGLSNKDQQATTIANQALNTGNDNAGYFKKFKVQRSDVARITAAASRARTLHRHYTTPFGDDNWRLLPATLVIEYTKEMRQCRHEFESAVSDLENQWATIVTRNQTTLGALFDPNDYPAQADIAKFYELKTEFRPIPQSDHLLIQIENESLDKLRKDIERQNQEGNEAMRRELWQRLYEPVKKMADRLADTKSKFHDSLVGNVQTILDILPALNVNQDPQLAAMANEISRRLCAFTPGQLRDDLQARVTTATEAAEIAAKMDAFMGGNAAPIVPPPMPPNMQTQQPMFTP